MLIRVIRVNPPQIFLNYAVATARTVFLIRVIRVDPRLIFLVATAPVLYRVAMV